MIQSEYPKRNNNKIEQGTCSREDFAASSVQKQPAGETAENKNNQQQQPEAAKQQPAVPAASTCNNNNKF